MDQVASMSYEYFFVDEINGDTHKPGISKMNICTILKKGIIRGKIIK